MPTYRDSAVVLRVGKLGEADRIITMLTKRSGRVRAVAKGVRRTKSRFGGRLEPFNHVDAQLYTGRSLDTVTQAVTLDSFGSAIAADYGRYTAATVIVETADRLAAEDRQPWLRLYLLVVSALRALCEPTADPRAAVPLGAHDSADRSSYDGDRDAAQDGSGPRFREPGLVMDAFLLRSLALAGWAPALASCARCATPGPHAAFQVAAGGLLCGDCRAGGGFSRPAPETVLLLRALADGDWTVAEATAAEHRREASGLVAALAQFHLERNLRSLPLVDRHQPAVPVEIGAEGVDAGAGSVDAGERGRQAPPAPDAAAEIRPARTASTVLAGRV